MFYYNTNFCYKDTNKKEEKSSLELLSIILLSALDVKRIHDLSLNTRVRWVITCGTSHILIN